MLEAFHSTESISFSDPEIWGTAPTKLNELGSLSLFKDGIKKLQHENVLVD